MFVLAVALSLGIVSCEIDAEEKWMPAEEIYDTDFIRIPDANFAAYCLTRFDSNKDGMLTRREVASVTDVEVVNLNIKSLQGIEYFTSLVSLDCSYNYITALDLSNNTELKYLNCLSNRLTSLDLSHNAELTYLHCCYNRLEQLDLSHNPNMQEVICSDNRIESLDLSQNGVLIKLECQSNLLTTLDVSHTRLGGSHYSSPLSCAQMETLETLCVKTGWHIRGVTEGDGRSALYIPEQTRIVFVD